MATDVDQVDWPPPSAVGRVLDPRRRARIALSLLATLAVVHAVDGGLAIASVIGGDDPTRLGQRALVLLVGFGLEVVVGVTFITWLVRVTHNLRELGVRHLRHGTVWAAIGWFVPVLALFRPAQVTGDALVASDARWQPGTHGWREASWPTAFRLWWAGFLLSSVLGQLNLGLVVTAADDELLRPAAAVVGLVADGIAVVTLVLASWVVRVTTARQLERAERLGVRTWTSGPSRRWPTATAAVATAVVGLVAVVPDLLPAPAVAERSATGQVVTAGPVAWEDLQVGDCFTLPRGEEVHRVDVVPCDQPHRLTVIGVTQLSAPEDEPYPGDDAALVRGMAVCESALATAVSDGRADGPEDLLVVTPPRASWAVGDRLVVCLVESGPPV